jgi:ribosomal protein S18 acetylase RimI-like enzyme
MGKDFEEVRVLWESAGSGVRLSASDSRDELLKKLQRDPDLFLVGEEAGRIIGCVLGGFDGRRGFVYHLAVAEGQRRQGFGRRLMGELERRLKAKGCLKYYLLVTTENPSAVHFYQEIGCEIMDMHILGKVLT